MKYIHPPGTSFTGMPSPQPDWLFQQTPACHGGHKWDCLAVGPVYFETEAMLMTISIEEYKGLADQFNEE